MNGGVQARRLLLGVGGLFLALGAAVCANVQPDPWQIEVVDPNGGGSSSLRVDRYGNAHVAYIDELRNVLKYSFWDKGLHKWFTTTVDRGFGTCSLVLDREQHAHISYDEYGTGKLKYAYWDGYTWQKQTIETAAKQIAFYNSIALDLKGNPMISYYEYFGASDENSLRLRVASWNGTAWEVRTVDDTKGSGKFNSIATDSSGNPRIGYGNVKYEDASLRYARWDGRSWQIEIIEGAGTPGTSRWSVSMILDKADNPHIACTDVNNRLVKYATRKDNKWQIEVVDSLVKEGYPDRYGIALDAEGNPYLSYYDAGIGVLKVAWRKNGQWVHEVVDQNFAGFTSSLQIYDGTIWVTYEDEGSRSLKCARRLLGRVDTGTQDAISGQLEHILEQTRK